MNSATVTGSSAPRPLSVLILGWLFIVVGIGGLVLHVREINWNSLFERDLILAAVVRISAIVGGMFLLRGDGWARWLLIAWTLFHVILSMFHPLSELITHCVIMAAVSFFLLRSKVSEFLRTSRTQTPASS